MKDNLEIKNKKEEAKQVVVPCETYSRVVGYF